MVFNVYIKFKSQFGQSVAMEWKTAEDELFHAVEFSYLNEDHWKGSITVNNNLKGKTLQYRYLLRQGDSVEYDLWPERLLDLKFTGNASVDIYDEWQSVQIGGRVFASRPFVQVFAKLQPKIKLPVCKKPTHLFKVHVPQLPEGMVICMLGSGNTFKNWDQSDPVRLRHGRFNIWSVELDLSQENFPIEYKYVVYDAATGKLVRYEDGYNRILSPAQGNGHCAVLGQVAVFGSFDWKGAGVNVQLSSLRSEKSWGVGDFSDLNSLSAWAKLTGIKMIQLLPINDTTATFTKSDSYPYSAISAFALHPIFLDVADMAKKSKVKFHPQFQKKANALNASETLEYDQVLELKTEAARKVFDQQYESFLESSDFKEFLAKHHYWLMPYAAFCFLREKYKTADFSQWQEYAVFDSEKLNLLVSETSIHFREIAFYYFIQFHLDRQLQVAVSFAHKRGIIMKGDLPIGVGRYSIDTWMNPGLFNMDMQAGAPPDLFTRKGQNWSFPTYNWENMRLDGYAWWRKRLQHMSHYFDAIRIDHILGFFRIWSVPMHAIEGIFGYFVPAIPLAAADFIDMGIDFNEARYCDPYLTEEVLDFYLGDDKAWVQENMIAHGKLKIKFNSQRKLEAYFNSNNLDGKLKQKLFDLLADVILLRDESKPGKYHFRINIEDTLSFKTLDKKEQKIVSNLYFDYFFNTQNDLWLESSKSKLDAIQHGSDMMICAEDLGMVPPMVEGVLRSREMLALQVQRMPKTGHLKFSHPSDAPYLSVVTPSTHDMSTIREWWLEDFATSQDFYNNMLHLAGKAPAECEPAVCEAIIKQHLLSPAMWVVFLLQDLLSMDKNVRCINPFSERINNPADPNHYWNYRLHISLELLCTQELLSEKIARLIASSERS